MPDASTDPHAPRRRWMAALARARRDELETAAARLAPLPDYAVLRPAEVGLVMVEGRAGGSGDRFPVGEMTVTRCTVRLGDGTAGHAWIAGRDGRHAELAAMFDALLQRADWHDRVRDDVIEPLRDTAAARRGTRAREAAATRVDFFTVLRGEDAP
ncbi:MAG: phosphonate C-P lyase system protein PhnG [Alphaproteobacteria bacterium]